MKPLKTLPSRLNAAMLRWRAEKAARGAQLGRPRGPWRLPVLAVMLAAFCGGAAADLTQFDQNAVLYSATFQRGVNYRSFRGVALSSIANNPTGSDGRAPATPAPSANQFRGFLSVGAAVVPANRANLNLSSANLSQNADGLNLPRGGTGASRKVLRSAAVGSPVFSRPIAFLFGSVITPPETTETGTALTPVQARAYWVAEPHTTTGHAGASYYWSPHANAVFAIQPGPIQVIWRKVQASNTQPADYGTNPGRYFLESGVYYTLTNASYIVSGSASKTPRKMYWTEQTFRATGKPVKVPTARVSTLRFVYNNSFPERVTEEFKALGQSDVVGNATNRLQELRTIWYDASQKQIFAYNKEGRVFLELLGDQVDNGVHKHLGFEIVDVFQQVPPADLTVELGEKIVAYSDTTSDASLNPEPVLDSGGQSYLYQTSTTGIERSDYYAVRETRNLNDVLVHWLEAGVEGLRWPLIFARYKLLWPTDITKYSQYVRPETLSEAEARLTAVQLPTQNAPAIQYQDVLDFPRAKLTENFGFYTILNSAQPAHRTLLRFNAGERVAFERVFSWMDTALKTPAKFTNSVAATLGSWNSNTLAFEWSSASSSNRFVAPRVISAAAPVGDRILAPDGELGGSGEYLAGYILPSSGNSYHPGAYIDPFAAGFEAANVGAIIPVNVLPGKNNLDVWWFRKNATTAIRNETNGFYSVYWPAVIGRYTLSWPGSPSEIVLASNDGSGGLESLEANGTIYVQNDPQLTGYNPNEEHALMIGGQAYALRDDLNITAGAGYSSHPFVLLDFIAEDGRPKMRAFQVLREKASEGLVFDYITVAGAKLQAPMPLPLLTQPIEWITNNATVPPTISVRNYNTEPSANSGDLPVNWQASSASGPYGHYARFTFKDRKDDFWVMRGNHGGLPVLAAGAYNTVSKTFGALPAATAIVGGNFTYHIHTSRRTDSLVLALAQNSSPLPAGISIDGLTLRGVPQTVAGATTVSLVLTDTGDGNSVSLPLSITVAATGSMVAQGPLLITSANQYSGVTTTHVGRPPFLAAPPVSTNSFTMRFYYNTQEGFAWPGHANPPAVGTIVPYLRPAGVTDTASAGAKTTPSLDIVYRPVWPSAPPSMAFGQTLTVPRDGLPAVRGQSSMEVLYQQSIATDLNAVRKAVVLHDPTVAKSFKLQTNGHPSVLSGIPATVRSEIYQGKRFFPLLPPHLAQRFYYDPARGVNGALVLEGQFKDEALGEKYLLPNILSQQDLTTLKSLCPAADTANKSKWDVAINGLSVEMITYKENPEIPKTWIVDPQLTRILGSSEMGEITNDDTAVDSYALSAAGPGSGYVTVIAGNGGKFTPEGEPVSIYVLRVRGQLYRGEVKVLPSQNPLNELITFQHTADLGGNFAEYEYEWKHNPPVDGFPPATDATMSAYQPLTSPALVNGQTKFTLGGAGVKGLVDQYVVMRYRPKNSSHPLVNAWSPWTEPQLAEGWIKRVLAQINPFNQRVDDLFNNSVNTDASILMAAGKRYEGDVALNLENINNYGLIEIYETILKRGKLLSIDAGINFGPANDALLLAAGYLADLYLLVGNEAYADAANPTIGIGSSHSAYGDLSTALFSFKGQLSSLLDEELALLRGRDDVFQPGIGTGPVYNRLVWNYTRGIDSGEVIYALNYNVLDQNTDGRVDATDAATLYPQGHGDAYGHYLTALKGYYTLLMNSNFDWVPRIEAVTVLGKAVSVDYLDERKFASAAAALARTGNQVFDLAWRKDYRPGKELGWAHLSTNRVSSRTMTNGATPEAIVRHWGADQWASRTVSGAFLNWVAGNAILPAADPDPSHEGIQKIDRTTVTELQELVATAEQLMTEADNAEGRLSPLGLPEGSLAFDINPNLVVGTDPQTHFEQVYGRATEALQNAHAAFDDAKDVTGLMRSEQDSLADLRADIARQELSYTNALIELYGSPYPDDIGPTGTYRQGYAGPDLVHYMYVENPELNFNGRVTNTAALTFQIDTQDVDVEWLEANEEAFNFVARHDGSNYDAGTDYFTFVWNPHGFYGKPANWTGRRSSPGQIQQGISEFARSHFALQGALIEARKAKKDFDDLLSIFSLKNELYEDLEHFENVKFALEQTERSVSFASDIAGEVLDRAIEAIENQAEILKEALPQSLVAGLASGGDLTSGGRAAALEIAEAIKQTLEALQFANEFAEKSVSFATETAVAAIDRKKIPPLMRKADLQQALWELNQIAEDFAIHYRTINRLIRERQEKHDAYLSLVAQGDRLQQERQVFRQRAAAVVQGYRTRDAAFRIFRNEKLERYKTLFDLASRYSFLAANAYDYETGLLYTPEGKAFVNRIINSRALGVIRNGNPQYAGSNTGDPGLSSVLAEMKADWSVLKGRLGFNNADAYGTTVSLRTENLRILPGTEGDPVWQEALQAARVEDLLQDVDVRRYCMQIDPGNGLPLPGIVLTFSTTIAPNQNLFGRPLAGGDNAFHRSSFATKLFAAGVALEGYRGMNNPVANGTSISQSGGSSPEEPSSWFLDPKALSATPYVYLIPVGVDSMRSPPLGDVSVVRTWAVDDVTIPLPFNLGASDFSANSFYTSDKSLTEPLFALRKHQAFRPVSTTLAFRPDVYGGGGSLQASQYTNRRLIGRSVWNSKWKLVIPGDALLNDPKEGLDRLVKTLTDVKLYFVTYGYSGN